MTMEEENDCNSEEEDNKRQSNKKCKVAALGANFVVQILNFLLTATTIFGYEYMEGEDRIRKRKGRYLRRGIF